MYTISKITSNSVIDFAAEELKKYLRMMMPEGGDVKIAYNPEATDGFRLGLMQDFGLDVSDAENTELDDILYIDTDERGGIIAGSNPRSVLLSVYEYFRQMGCRWLFPGVDGEYIPMKNITPVKYRHKPTARYRGNCIEGATSQQMLCNFIEFMPKIGLNTFMLQFKIPATFYERHYSHVKTDDINRPETITLTTATQWTRAIECEIAKRGIMLHSYGHGFTQDPFDIGTSTGWQTMDSDSLPKEKREYLAELGGRRAFFKNAPLNTNVCMSNPKVRSLIASYVASYCEKHSNTDFLHIWPADDYNNHCECSECVKKSPSDWYVMILNEVDEELTKKGLHSRVVFIVSEEIIWRPVVERLKNPDRFTLMIAPISREFTFTLDESITPSTVPYERNKIVLPRDLGTYLEYFKGWQEIWSGKNLVFDYHTWLAFHYDISGLKLARVVYDDNRLFRERGFDGTIECGTERCFFPHGLVQYTHARCLFDSSLPFEDIVSDYFRHAFGDDYKEFIKYLTELEEYLPYVYVSRTIRNLTLNIPKVIEKLRGIYAVIEKGRKLIKDHYDSDFRMQTVSVRILERHAYYTERVVRMLLSRIDGDQAAAEKAYEELFRDFCSLECEMELYADPYQTLGQIKRFLTVNIEENNSDTEGEPINVHN